MRHALLILCVAVLLCEVAAAQESAPKAQIPARVDHSRGWRSDDQTASQQVGDRRDTFKIEIKVLEGRGPLADGPTDAKSPTVAAAPFTRGSYVRSRMAQPLPARAILPNPVALPDRDLHRSDSAPNKRDEDLLRVPPDAPIRATENARSAADGAQLWDDAQKKPGVTVLATPTLAVVGGQTGVIQIQSEQIFEYLEPVGEGKYQAKHTEPTELGMKFVLGVQTVEGDARSVEISPLEIQLAVLDGREPVEGLDLEVGKPIIATRSLKTTAKMKLGVARMIPIPSGPKTQAALLLRISPIDSAGHERRVLPPATSPDPDESSP